MKHKQTLAMLLSMPLGAYAQGTAEGKFHRFGAAVCGGQQSTRFKLNQVER